MLLTNYYSILLYQRCSGERIIIIIYIYILFTIIFKTDEEWIYRFPFEINRRGIKETGEEF